MFDRVLNTPLRCFKIQSFGKLKYFAKQNKPKEAIGKCLDCAIKLSCPHSVVRQYINPFKADLPNKLECRN